MQLVNGAPVVVRPSKSMQMLPETESPVMVSKLKTKKREVRRYWESRYKAFADAGFTNTEATIAANEGWSLQSRTIKHMLQNRARHVKYFIDAGHTREESIQLCSADNDPFQKYVDRFPNQQEV